MARGETNTIILDDGTGGQNLQIGYDKTASHVANPTFVLWADGGAASYEAFIDGKTIGVFHGDGYGNCIIQAPRLPDSTDADPDYELTAKELAPNPAKPVTPFRFKIDTVPPSAPSAPELSGYSDTLPPVGDNITNWRTPNFHGTTDIGTSVQLKVGPTGIAGSGVSQDGNYSATTSTLKDGVYDIYAVAFDRAGNQSQPSAPTRITITQTGGVNTPEAPSLDAATRAIALAWSPRGDGNSPITAFRIYRGPYGATNELLAEVPANVHTYTVRDAQPWEYFAVSAVNALGEGPKSNAL